MKYEGREIPLAINDLLEQSAKQAKKLVTSINKQTQPKLKKVAIQKDKKKYKKTDDYNNDEEQETPVIDNSKDVTFRLKKD